MKQGKTIQELAVELKRQAEAKKDFVANTQALALVPVENGVQLEVGKNGQFPVNEHAHGQIAARLKIPKDYYDRMRTQQPGLLATNVNTWFQANPERRLIRTLDGRTRAFLSERYRRIDNIGLVQRILPRIRDYKGVELASCEVTERKLYMKFVVSTMQAEIKVGDVVRAGFIMMNSEIGVGQADVSPFVDRLNCTNGMTLTEFGARRRHVGRIAESDEEAYELYSDRTLRADDEAYYLKVVDTVNAVLQEEKFKLIVDSLKSATERKIQGDPREAVEVVSKRFGLNESEESDFLKHLIEGGDLSAYGVAQAITRTSQDVENYDRASDLEKLGGDVITLGPSEWKVIANPN